MQDALFRTVLGTMRTVSHCFRYGIITLQEPQGIGEHPTPCGFCIARLRQGNTHLLTQQPECTSWAIYVLVSVAPLRTTPRRGHWVYMGVIAASSRSAWQRIAKRVPLSPSCPVSCRCWQLRAPPYAVVAQAERRCCRRVNIDDTSMTGNCDQSPQRAGAEWCRFKSGQRLILYPPGLTKHPWGLFIPCPSRKCRPPCKYPGAVHSTAGCGYCTL